MAVTEEILGQFLGDESFPVTWDSEAEKDFFWVYDDLHIPHPVSPMFFDIGVYCVVFGTLSAIALSLESDREEDL